MKQLGQTTNFTVRYDDSDATTEPIIKQRAQDVLDIVESEFSVLTSWFAVNNKFGAGHRVVVTLIVPADSQNAGTNQGYDAGWINIDPLVGRKNDPNISDIVRSLFVAEFVEILMDLKKTWDPSKSTGEGLSRFCALERFEAGYYALAGPMVNLWLQPDPARPDPLARENWISNTKDSDTDAESYSCALLFLYYLKSQLLKPVPNIIQAGGATLEDTYKSLTGGDGGYDALIILLNKFLPPGNTPLLTTNNPFPLLDVPYRQVTISVDQKITSPPQVVGSGSFNTRFLGCPPKSYHYDVIESFKEITCTATTIGFGQPVYNWQVNGVDVKSSGVITAMVKVWSDNPNSPQYNNPSIKPIQVYCMLSPAVFTSKLVLSVSPNVGHFEMSVVVFAIDKFPSSDVTSTSAFVTVDTEQVVFEPDYYKDGKHCRDAFTNRMRQLAEPFNRFNSAISIILTLPDPPLEYGRVVGQLNQIATELRGIAKSAPTQSKELQQGIEKLLGLESGLLQNFLRR